MNGQQNIVARSPPTIPLTRQRFPRAFEAPFRSRVTAAFDVPPLSLLEPLRFALVHLRDFHAAAKHRMMIFPNVTRLSFPISQ
jgi:hypothetical protein